MTDPVWIDQVQAYPDVKNNQVKVRVTIGNMTGQIAEGTLEVKAASRNTESPRNIRPKGRGIWDRRQQGGGVRLSI